MSLSSNSSDCSPIDQQPSVAVSAKRANLYNDAPEIVKQLVRVKRTNGVNYTAYRSSYTAVLSLTSDMIANGVPREFTIAAHLDKELRSDAANAPGATYCVVAADATSVESTFDFALAWRLDTLPTRKKLRVDACPFEPGEHVIRTVVVEPRQAKPSVTVSETNRPLIIKPLFYSDRSADVSFSVIDAWGFDSAVLMQNVVRALPGERYYIPTSYPYSYLIARVHCCIKLANARAHANALYAETMSESAYSVPNSRSGFIIDKADLDTVIEYIDTRLLSSLVKFNPNSLSLICTPFEPLTWLEIYQRYAQEQQSRNALATSTPTEPLKCTVKIVVWYVRLDNPLSVSADGTIAASSAVHLLQTVNAAPPAPQQASNEHDSASE